MGLSGLSILLALAATAWSSHGASAGAQPADAILDCPSDAGTELICGREEIEDLIRAEGTPWVIGSWRHKGLTAIDTRTRIAHPLFPSRQARIALDRKRYPDCPGPAIVSEAEPLEVLGVALRRVSRGRFVLYAVRVNSHAGIYVFDLDTRGILPRVTFCGCVATPGNAALNSVVALPNGGFASTQFGVWGAGQQDSRARMLLGENSGGVFEWHPRRGWSEVLDSDMSGANGIALARDGKSYFVSAWAAQRIMRIPRAGKHGQRLQSATLGFRPDNIRWASDGTLLVAGQQFETGGRINRTLVIRVDPASLKFTMILDREDTDRFKSGTVALEVGDRIWVASSRAKTIAVLRNTIQ